ncbi:19344_t:CDS:2 [Cetraspora pellucida]|uniref:19344_t:CDS:1 n=1 Tax=Cetraspora pellucida TaxID=1433469 RepID=A0A9N8VWI9_9GLOM|nr:19344_t:CDS:2 [Cetraspora pellucida]
MSNKKTATTKTNDTITNDTITNDNNATTNLAKGHLIPIVNVEVGETDMANDSTYDPRKDDNYNINEDKPLDNFSEEYSKWCEENDSNEYKNPEPRQERLNQN